MGKPGALEIVEVLKPSNPHVKLIFETVGAEPGGYYTHAEVTEVVFAYCRERGLDTRGSSPAHVQLDPYLSDALYKVGGVRVLQGARARYTWQQPRARAAAPVPHRRPVQGGAPRVPR